MIRHGIILKLELNVVESTMKLLVALHDFINKLISSKIIEIVRKLINILLIIPFNRCIINLSILIHIEYLYCFYLLCNNKNP